MVKCRDALLALAWVAMSACAGDKVESRTELIIVADTDITGLTAIRFTVGGAQPEQVAMGDLAQQSPPITLGLVRKEGPLGPVSVLAEGIEGNTVRVRREAVVAFLEGQTRVVPMHLTASCMQRTCIGSGQTCTETGCEKSLLDPEALPTWDGTPPSLDLADAGLDAAGVDGGAAADAGAVDLTDCGPGATSVDLSSDENHCGSCSNVCKAQHNLIPVCNSGVCEEVCKAFYADCDGKPPNGCEQFLGVPDHCGACDVACKPGQSCVFGMCR